MTTDKFESIFKQYRYLVMREAYDVLDDYHLAQDVCQDVFIKVSFDHLEQLKTEEDIKRFLKSVAYHRAVDYYRVLKKLAEIQMGLAGTSSITDITQNTNWDLDTEMIRDEFMGIMFRDLYQKNPVWCEIVRRVGFYDEEPIIVARDMNISLNHLRVMYHRAKLWVRKNYAEEYEFLNWLF